jgi:hypothetical protein
LQVPVSSVSPLCEEKMLSNSLEAGTEIACVDEEVAGLTSELFG